MPPKSDPRVSVDFFVCAMKCLKRTHKERCVSQDDLNALIRHLGQAETHYRAMPRAAAKKAKPKGDDDAHTPW